MTVYIDNLTSTPSGYRCRLMTDQDELLELHKFAERVGLLRAWYQHHDRHPHYRVTDVIRERAIAQGAIPVDSKTMEQLCVRLRYKPRY